MIKKIIKQLLATLLSIVKIFLLFNSIGKGYKLKKNIIDKKCLILANGPSLKEDLDRLTISSNYDYFVVNFFALSDHFFRLKPRYYVFADEAFWNSEEEMHPEVVVLRKQLMEQFNKVDWAMSLFVPYKGFKNNTIKGIVSNKCISLNSYNTASFEGFPRLEYYLYRNNICMPLAQNVLIPTIYLAINNGYRDIELYGADFSWTRSICVNHENVLCQIDAHFYDNGEVKLSPVLGYVDRPYRMHNYLHDLSNMFYGCWQIRNYADKCDARILNHNINSFIDAFNKI